MVPDHPLTLLKTTLPRAARWYQPAFPSKTNALFLAASAVFISSGCCGLAGANTASRILKVVGACLVLAVGCVLLRQLLYGDDSGPYARYDRTATAASVISPFWYLAGSIAVLSRAPVWLGTLFWTVGTTFGLLNTVIMMGIEADKHSRDPSPLAALRLGVAAVLLLATCAFFASSILGFTSAVSSPAGDIIVIAASTVYLLSTITLVLVDNAELGSREPLSSSPSLAARVDEDEAVPALPPRQGNL